MSRRELPHAPEAEVAVLGGMILDNDAAEVALEMLRPIDFYAERHRRLFAAAAEIRRRGGTVDPVSISEELTATGELDRVGGVQYVAELMAAVPSAANLAWHAAIVRDRARRRQLIEAASEIIHDAYGSAELDELFDTAESRVFAVAERATSSGGPAAIGDLLHGTFEMMEQLSAAALPTGIRDLDAKLRIRPGNLIIVGGATSMGKSSVGLAAALHVAIREAKPVLFFSVEMTREENVMRAIAIEALADLDRLMRGCPTDDEVMRMTVASQTLRGAPLWIDDTATSAAEMRSRARRFMAEHPDLALIVVDHIHDMQGPGEERRHQVGKIGRDLKRLAKELHVPVMALAQLSRKPAERTDHRPQVSDLFEAGDLEQVADAIVLVYRPEYYHGPTMKVGKGKNETVRNIRGLAELIIGKQRNGPTGSVEAYFRASCARFEDLAKSGAWGNAA